MGKEQAKLPSKQEVADFMKRFGWQGMLVIGIGEAGSDEIHMTSASHNEHLEEQLDHVGTMVIGGLSEAARQKATSINLIVPPGFN